METRRIPLSVESPAFYPFTKLYASETGIVAKLPDSSEIFHPYTDRSNILLPVQPTTSENLDKTVFAEMGIKDTLVTSSEGVYKAYRVGKNFPGIAVTNPDQLLASTVRLDKRVIVIMEGKRHLVSIGSFEEFLSISADSEVLTKVSDIPGFLSVI